MRSQREKALVIMLGVFLAVSARTQAEDTQGTVAGVFNLAVSSDGETYLAARSKTLAYGERVALFLERKQLDDSLHVRVIGEALLSWIRNPDRGMLCSEKLLEYVRNAQGSHIPSILPILIMHASDTGAGGYRFPPASQRGRRLEVYQTSSVPFLLEVVVKELLTLPDGRFSPREDVFWARCGAAVIVGAIESKDAPLVLIEQLRNAERYELRACAAAGLGRRQNLIAVEPLIDTLSDQELVVRRSARDSLKRISAQDFGYQPEDIPKWREWWEQNKETFPKKK